MLLENNILNADFFDYPIFAIESTENLKIKFFGGNKKQIFISI